MLVWVVAVIWISEFGLVSLNWRMSAIGLNDDDDEERGRRGLCGCREGAVIVELVLSVSDHRDIALVCDQAFFRCFFFSFLPLSDSRFFFVHSLCVFVRFSRIYLT